MATIASTAPAELIPLPKRLMSFFIRYPPERYAAKYITAPLLVPPLERLKAGQSTSNLDRSKPQTPLAANASTIDSNNSVDDTNLSEGRTAPGIWHRNPFLPWKNPKTGRWRGAAIGLRRQAELVKMAKAYGVEELLPSGRKSTAFKEQRILERGLRVRGTGEGQKVKGHKWERMMSVTVEKRKKAMEEMPGMIRRWKQLGHGRGWKRYPK